MEEDDRIGEEQVISNKTQVRTRGYKKRGRRDVGQVKKMNR